LSGSQSIATPDHHFCREDTLASAETKKLVATLRDDIVEKIADKMRDEYDLDKINRKSKANDA